MSRMRMNKEDYDNLYFYATGSGPKHIMESGRFGPWASPRRYATIDEARKAALSKSKRLLGQKRTTGVPYPTEVWVFKRTRPIGIVECKLIPGKAAFAGTWTTPGSREPVLIRADGTIMRGR